MFEFATDFFVAKSVSKWLLFRKITCLNLRPIFRSQIPRLFKHKCFKFATDFSVTKFKICDRFFSHKFQVFFIPISDQFFSCKFQDFLNIKVIKFATDFLVAKFQICNRFFGCKFPVLFIPICDRFFGRKF